MPPADQAPVVERHWCLRILPTLQWTVLGILVLVTAVFYEDVNAMRLAARAAVLGPKATEGVGLVHETEASQVASNQLELGRKGGPKAPVLTAPFVGPREMARIQAAVRDVKAKELFKSRSFWYKPVALVGGRVVSIEEGTRLEYIMGKRMLCDQRHGEVRG